MVCEKINLEKALFNYSKLNYTISFIGYFCLKFQIWYLISTWLVVMEGNLAGVPFLDGSVHTFTPGYGYGARVPTARNQPTLPASIPKFRHPPLSERSENMCKSMVLDLTGSKSTKRHSDQLALQTSGDYGRFMYPSKTDDRQNDHVISRPKTTAISSISAVNNLNTDAFKSSFGNDSQGNGRSAIRNDYDTILKYRRKDPLEATVMKYSKYDLLASKAPPRDTGQLHWCVVGNQMAAEHSRTWQLNLRPVVYNNSKKQLLAADPSPV